MQNLLDALDLAIKAFHQIDWAASNDEPYKAMIQMNDIARDSLGKIYRLVNGDQEEPSTDG
jgi:hypothetical protein